MGGAIGNIHWELDGTHWEQQQPKNSMFPPLYPQNEKNLELLGAHKLNSLGTRIIFN
jgi:hypothetical protein